MKLLMHLLCTKGYKYSQSERARVYNHGVRERGGHTEAARQRDRDEVIETEVTAATEQRNGETVKQWIELEGK